MAKSKPITDEYTYRDFIAEYPDDDACLDKIFEMIYGDMISCPKCGYEKRYVRVRTRKAYQCRKCYNSIHVLRSTPFSRTRTPLTSWFYAIFLFTKSKHGLPALELARTIGVTPKTALRMLKQIRIFITNDESKMGSINSQSIDNQEVVIDESFVGGLNKNRHKDKKVAKCQGRSYKDKTPVFGMLEKSSGRLIAKVMPNVQGKTIKKFLLKYVHPGATLHTDEYKGYNGLEKIYNRKSCNHSAKIFVAEGASTNALESAWNNLKKSYRVYAHMTKKYIHLYVKEFVFRFNNRNSKNVFRDLLYSIVY